MIAPTIRAAERAVAAQPVTLNVKHCWRTRRAVICETQMPVEETLTNEAGVSESSTSSLPTRLRIYRAGGALRVEVIG